MNIFTARVDFEGGIAKRRMQNSAELKKPYALTSPALIKKVQSFAARWGLSPETVYEKIQTDWLFALWFAKDPGRQSIHQELAANFLKKTFSPLISGFRVLPSGGCNAKWVCAGGVFTQKEMDNRGVDKQARTIDFEWAVPCGDKTLSFYASHKFTGEEGGAQNNQYEDLKNFVDCVRKARSPEVFYLAIADGPYYLRPDTQIQRPRLDVLNEGRGSHSRWAACTSNQVGWFIGEEIKKALSGLPDCSLPSALADMPENLPSP